MVEQLNILGLWERTPEGPKEPEKPVDLPPLLPVDPRQGGLASRMHVWRSMLRRCGPHMQS